MGQEAAPGERTPRWRQLVDAVVGFVQPDNNPSSLVYGTLLVGALLAAESSRQETFERLTEALVVALALYWLAHGYARLLGDRFERGTRWSARRLLEALWLEWALVRGAATPLVALLFAWALGATLTTAVTIALWTCVGTLVGFELLAGLHVRLPAGQLVTDVGMSAVVGLGVLALKVILH